MAGWFKPDGPVLSMGLAVLLALAGGFAASHLKVPLAWVLGPLVFCAAASLAGLTLRPIPGAREGGQVIIGLAIGLRMTPAVVAATMSLVPAMVVGTFYVIAITTVAAFGLRISGQVDRKTAFFATSAAGMVEMAVLAHKLGGDPRVVSIVHAIRVASIVLVVPPLVFAFGMEGNVEQAAIAPLAPPLILAGLAAVACALVYVTRVLHFPSPWFTGPILAGIGAAALLDPISVPWTLFIAAQMTIGIALGCRFDRALLKRLPRVVVSALALSAVLVLASALGAIGLSAVSGLSLATSFLSIAPAAAAEMVLTAGIMHLDTTSVTAFHIVRIALINATALVTYKLYDRIADWLDSRKSS
jgi:membrane AbrB-like protein